MDMPDLEIFLTTPLVVDGLISNTLSGSVHDTIGPVRYSKTLNSPAIRLAVKGLCRVSSSLKIKKRRYS